MAKEDNNRSTVRARLQPICAKQYLVLELTLIEATGETLVDQIEKRNVHRGVLKAAESWVLLHVKIHATRTIRLVACVMPGRLACLVLN